MDLESYALTAAQEVDRSNDSTERADAKGKGKQREPDLTGISSGEAEEDVTLEADVKHIANSVSSWWSGFSKRTQEQLASAQSHIADQGGLVQFARNEAAKIERSIDEVRKESMAKQKQEKEQSEKEAAAADKAGEAGEAPSRSSEVTPTEASSSSSTATRASSSLPSTSTNPQIASLQHEISSRLYTLFSSNTSSSSSSTNLTRSVQSALQDVSASLKQLGGPEGKAYAQRYLEASRELVGKAGDEWKEMVGELVRVVPPEQQQQEGEKAAAAAEELNEKAGVQAAEKGKDMAAMDTKASSEEQPAPTSSAALQPPSLEQKDEDAFSWEDGGDEGSHSRDSSSGKKEEEAPSSKEAEEAVGKEKKETSKSAEDSDDSDWE